MAQLKDLIVNGDSRFLGAMYGDLTGNADTATKATGDESGNNIKASYAANLSYSNSKLRLVNKNGAGIGDEITISIPSGGMTFKGTVGSGGTIEWSAWPPSNPVAGWTYKVITAHTTAPICKVGDLLIYDSNSTWQIIPSGDDGTVTSVGTGAGLTGGPITTTGTIKAKLKSETALAAAAATPTDDNNRNYAVRVDKDGYLAVIVPWVDTDTNTAHTHTNGVGLIRTGDGGVSGTVDYKAALASYTLDTNAAITRPPARAERTYPVIPDSAGNLAVIVPWDAGGDTAVHVSTSAGAHTHTGSCSVSVPSVTKTASKLDLVSVTPAVSNGKASKASSGTALSSGDGNTDSSVVTGTNYSATGMAQGSTKLKLEIKTDTSIPTWSFTDVDVAKAGTSVDVADGTVSSSGTGSDIVTAVTISSSTATGTISAESNGAHTH